MAVDVDDVPNAQRSDLALLLSLVENLVAMASELTAKDRKRLRARREMTDPDERAWANLPHDAVDRGRAAHVLLSR